MTHRSGLLRDFFLARAYIVNREIALYLLKNAQSDVKIPIDLWLNDLANIKK